MPDPPHPGRVLDGRYRLTSPVARGGMATVWDAEDTLLARRVAVKILHPELAFDEALRARFRNEAVAAARLADPGIVATYDTGDD
ncbi:MAG TPA: serine/threonine protein kinase, partial [Acidimicrobiia bacterium]|nr:serine/threonine protein kinase [Acidimicrobiia bacterium]